MASKSRPVDTESWHRLYDAAVRVKELSPWQWMEEGDLFGMQEHNSEEPSFISVMGMGEQHYAVSVYLGIEALYQFYALQFEAEEAVAERLLEIPQLQASFEDRETLEKKDRDLIKELGLKFRGRHAYPMFRAIKPGYLPWFLEADEVPRLTLALEQLLEVAPRVKADPSLLTPADDETFFVRVARKQKSTIIWEDRNIRVSPPPPRDVPLPINDLVLKRLQKLPLSQNCLEVDFFMIPMPVIEKNRRPFFPHLLLIVDAASGMVVGSELCAPEPSVDEMWASVPNQLIEWCARVGLLPGTIAVSSELLAQMFELLAKELRIKIVLAESLPGLDQARLALLTNFS